MAACLICADVSEFQKYLDGTYTRDVLIFRVEFGDNYLDPKFLANAAAAKKLYDAGRIAGVILYTVYTAASVKSQFDAVWRAIGPDLPDWLMGIMIDVELWRGTSYELSGDHSKAINRLYGLHAHKMGSFDSVLVYGNSGDLAELFPHRDRRCRLHVAAYTSQLVYKTIKGAIGQQYTDGQTKNPVPSIGGKPLPRASQPFGNCDHNVFPAFKNGDALRTLLRPSGKPPKRPRKPRGGKPPGPKPHYDVRHGNRLVSPSGNYALFLQDSGALELRLDGKHDVYLAKEA